MPRSGPDPKVEKLASQLSELAYVEAVILGGSISTGISDGRSDCDLYVYTWQPIDLPLREAILKPRAARLELQLFGARLGSGSRHALHGRLGLQRLLRHDDLHPLQRLSEKPLRVHLLESFHRHARLLHADVLQFGRLWTGHRDRLRLVEPGV